MSEKCQQPTSEALVEQPNSRGSLRRPRRIRRNSVRAQLLYRHRIVHIPDHGLRDLELAHDHGGGAMLFEVKYLLLGMGPRNDQEVRIDGARLHHDLPAFEGIGNGHQETTGGGELRRAHHFAVHGMPVMVSMLC